MASSTSPAPQCPISPVRTSRPELTLSPASINLEPIELDSTPASPEALNRRGSKTTMAGPEALTPEEQEKRAQIISERQANPAVLVDIPQTPGPDQLERAAAAAAAAAAAMSDDDEALLSAEDGAGGVK